MKKIALCLLSVSSAALAAAPSSQPLTQALAETDVSLNARTFYFDRSFDAPNKPDAEALALGGIAKLETGDFYGAKIGAAYYGSFRVLTDQDKAGGTSVLEQGSGDNLSFLGELYYQQNLGKSYFRIGRQRLNTPLANDHDVRLLPTSYEAAVLSIGELQNHRFELGYIHKYTGLGSRLNEFEEVNSSTNNGIGYALVENTAIERLTVRLQYAKALGSADKNSSSKVKDYRYGDATYQLPSELPVTLKAQIGGNDYAQGQSSLMYGLNAELGLSNWTVGALYNRIADNAFKAIESGPMFSDWQQGYNSYAPSQALGGYVTYKPMAALSVKLGSVQVSAREGYAAEDYNESLADVWYSLSPMHKFRLRYSYKNQSADSGIEDRQDFRLAYYLSF